MNSSNQSSTTSDLWVSCSKPNPQAKLRLFCFPYAGAGSSMFNVWSNFLLPEIELFLIHLPGRDRRLKESLPRQLSSLAETLADALYSWSDKPFAFFGHSMGALLCFETARQLRLRFSLQPSRLFVSGRWPPHMPDPNPQFGHLSEAEFLKATQHYYGALPEVVLQDPEVLQLFLKIMRSDITMLEAFEYRHEVPFDCPIFAFGGLQDPSTSERILAAWQDQTTSTFKLQMLPGSHFFIQTARAALLKTLNDEVFQWLLDLEGTGSPSNGSLSN